MSDTVIQIENLSKLYRLGNIGTGSLVQDMQRWWNRLNGKDDPFAKVGETNDRSRTGSSDFVWALKDISFNVKQGEVLGIIGRNGAGKSTLLKILSKTTTPTTGHIKIKGKVASLLEVGTGFHPDLTGRENIYLNGAILGMTKNDINRRFDEIVEFSGVARYIDTPVKRYSSGMYVRLAFAVAAHLESDVFIVDEVLAVGDAEFQKKCLGKMSDVSSKNGRTILFVSHNIAALQNLCTHGIIINNGELIFKKQSIKDAISYYQQTVIGSILTQEISNRLDRVGGRVFRFLNIDFRDKIGNSLSGISSGMDITIVFKYKTTEPIDKVTLAIGFNSLTGENKIVLWSEFLNVYYNLSQGEGEISCHIDKFPLAKGTYSVNLFSKSGSEVIDWLQEALLVNVEEGDFYGTGKVLNSSHNAVLINHQWH